MAAPASPSTITTNPCSGPSRRVLVTTRSAFIVPGQGGYLPGVFAHLVGHRCIQDTLAVVDETAAKLGRHPVSGHLTSLNAPKIQELAESDPAGLHLAIYATGIATARLLDEHGITPDLIIGHSFGEIAALAIVGVSLPRKGPTSPPNATKRCPDSRPLRVAWSRSTPTRDEPAT